MVRCVNIFEQLLVQWYQYTPTTLGLSNYKILQAWVYGSCRS